MKAYLVSDRNGSIPHSEIIFAETRGKAYRLALDTEEFCCGYESVKEE